MIRIISQDGMTDINYAEYEISCYCGNVYATPNHADESEVQRIAGYENQERAMQVMEQFRRNISGRGDTAVLIHELPKE